MSRQTFYRWKFEDDEFRKKVEEIISVGIESINDLAESTLIKNIKAGDIGCTKYWLSNNKYNYIRPRDKEFFQKTNVVVPDTPKRRSENNVEGIRVQIVRPEDKN